VAHWNPCHTCQPTTQRELAAELRAWQHQAEVIAAWQSPAQPLPAPCLACDARGVLLAKADASAAWCTACGRRWEGETEMFNLGKHVRAYRARAEAASAAARSRAVEERRRREGHSASAPRSAA
jgi:transcription elongation factor Elf1